MKKIKRLSTGQIRIISGQWRGRKLLVPCSQDLRPTADRVRETLFNWLAPSILDAFCLDCFAGSGSLSLEALSRYAAYTTLLEIKDCAVQKIKKNLAILKVINATVINTNTLHFLSKPGIGYNIVFIDPPFYKNMLEKTCYLLEKNGWLAKGALIYIESEANRGSGQIPAHWLLYRKKVAGQVMCRLYYRLP